jgi:hypothetical protein
MDASISGRVKPAFDHVERDTHRESEACIKCEPYGGSDYCMHCGRDMCLGLTRSAQREAGEKHRMRLHQPQRQITKDKYAEAILTQMDALRLIMSRRFDPGTVQMIATEALNTLYALGK